jgi:signal transduction histidine kinase
MWVQDKSGQIIWTNDTYRRFAGIAGAASDTSFYYSIHIHPEDRDLFLMAIIESTRVGGWTELQARIAGWPTGYQRFHIQLCHYTEAVEGTARWLALARDVRPGQQKTEGRPVQGDDKYALALKAAGMTIWEWEWITNEIVLQDWGQLFPGTAAGPSRMTLDGFLNYLQEEDAARLRKEMDRALTRQDGFWIELRLALPGKAERWVHLSAAAKSQRDKAGQGIIGILYDSTQGRLHQRQMDEFIGIASHEIRTPVSSIMAYSQLLQEELTTGRPTENGMRIVDRLAYQADRLSGLIRQLLDTTRISEQQLVLQYSWFDWEAMIGHCIETVEPTETTRRIRFENGQAGRVYADEGRLQQACLNLITNALKFSGPDQPVVVKTSRAGARVGFSV